MPAELSDYAKQRLANIAQNQSVLAQLGLADGECKLKPPPPPKKRPVPRKDDEEEEEPQQPTRKSARVANAPVCYTELSDEFCLREEKKLAALERVSSRPQRERKSITSYSDQQAEEIMANEEANATKRKQRARLQQQEEQRQRAALAAAAYAANPVLPDMTARFVPQQVTKKKGLCWRCGQMWSLRKDGTIRDHSCTPIVGAVAQQPFGSAHLPVM